MIRLYAPGLSSCFGEGFDVTLEALRAGRRGTRPLRDVAGFEVPGVEVVYADPDLRMPYQHRAAAHLRRALRGTLAAMPAGGPPGRTAALVCTGLGTTAGDESAAAGAGWESVEDAVRDELAGFGPVDLYPVTNACSASGTGLALAWSLLATDRYDQVVLASADSMTRAMLTMIGKVAPRPASHCAPFDEARGGAVLGEGAATCVLARADGWCGLDRFGTVASVECSSDASHPTAPDRPTIAATIGRALAAASIRPGDLDVVVPHGTGTALNDSCESAVYAGLPELVRSAGFLPLKGGLGHTSGASFLMSMIVAMAVCRGAAPPRYAPKSPIAQAAGLRWSPAAGRTPERALVCAYGFGGANATGVVAA